MNRSWTETVDGYSIVPVDGVYEYAKKVNGELVGNGIKVHDVGQRSIPEIAAISRIPKSLQPKHVPLKNSILSQVAGMINNKSMPTTGNIKVLALLIEYPDWPSTYATNDFDSLLNGNGFKTGESFSSFFYKSSNGQLTIQVDVFGWYTASNNYLYYADSSNNSSSKAAELVRDAVDAAEIAGVDFSQYDNDLDGAVDGIMAVHSGPGAEEGSQLQYVWSHRWGLAYANPSQSVTYDGKYINDYIINPETRTNWLGSRMVGVGVFCHEFGHNLGLPDLYDTDGSNGESEGLGNWALMSGAAWLGDEDFPGNFCAWSKIELGWEAATLINTSNPSSYILNPASTTQNEIFRMNIPSSFNEYFLLENRQKTALDSFLPGHGLAIFHINSSIASWSSGVNADENDKGVDLEEADGLNDLDNDTNRGDLGDLFPGSSLNTNFNDNSIPDARANNLTSSGIDITNISENNNIISFDLGMTGLSGCNGLTTLSTSSGSFSDGSALSNYINNLNCTWLIQPSGASTIDLTFNAFDTEAGHDSVTVYDGSSSSAPILGSFSGNNLPPQITSSGSSLFISFKTNSMTTAQGWSASYTSNSVGTLSANIDTVILNAAYGSIATIPISSNVNWSTSDNVPWAIPNNSFGSGSANITITATQPNIGPIRYGMFYIEDASNTLIDSVVIKQLGSGKYLNVSPSILLFPVNPTQNDSIMIQSSVNWTINNSLSWLSLSQSTGGTDAKIFVNATNNPSSLSRLGNISIQGSSGIGTKNVVVFQAGPLYVSPKNLTLNLAAASFKASSDNQTPISAVSPQSWLSMSKTIIPGNSGNPDTSAFQVVASQNNTSTSRSGFIIVDDTWSTDTVHITQLPSSNYVQTTPDTLRFSDAGGLASFDVFSDTTWLINSSSSFFNLSKSSGIYNEQVDVTVGTYLGSSPREELVYVSAVNDPNVLDSVLIFQDPLYSLDVNPNVGVLGSSLGSMDSLEINSNVNWTLSHSSSWLGVSQTSGIGFTKLMLTALSDNQSGANRKDTLIFSSSKHVDVKVEVTQLDASAPTFSVSTDTVYLQDYQGSKAIFTILSNQTWSVAENTSWLILNPLSGNGLKDIDLIAASRNIVGNTREAKVLISSPGFNDEEITVIQLGSTPLLSVSRDSILLSSDSGDVVSFNLSSNLTSWNISKKANWYEVSPVVGSFTQQIEVKSIDSNNTKKIRVDSVMISAPPHAAVYVKIKQDTLITVGLADYDLANSLKVYPNPAREVLSVEISRIEDINQLEINFYNTVGKKIQVAGSRIGNKLLFDISSLSGGFYILELSDGKQRISRIISVVGQF